MGIQHVLIIDDEPDIRELLEITLGRMKLHTRSVGSVRDAKALLGSEAFDLCLTDMRLPDGDGIELVEHIQAHHPCLPVAVITAYGSMDTAVQALKSGAFDFVSKPVDLTTLRDLVSSALKLSAPTATARVDRAHEASQEDDNLLGNAPAMLRLKATIAKLARSQAPVYILGESGSGKERVAQEIHRLGPRAERPLVPVNCGAIPAELMESEFFGHIKGSFTGAVTDKQGLFQAAQGGTLFLDEVAELPLHMQVKLLRAIQERAIKPVGAAREIAVDVRILSASHKDLATEVENGRFRQDLYYRLNVIELKVPSLRDRLEDLPRLADYILGRLAERWGESPRRLSGAAMTQLAGYHYPGNVRELENILERAATLCDGDLIQAEDLQLPRAAEPPAPAADTGRLPLEERLAHEEKRVILEALEAVGGDREKTAQRLGLSMRQLSFRLHRLGLKTP
ncbi:MULTISPECIES: sigma-54 dependent transcriptional regulator [unclassified Ectothiorhodospira]|uniref:sigma-54-dependent transcriptional regulator n=1 Tax=unclassified Ectothiorhodospira TaxID=2684909 RepID=UPI001EE78D9B|nr:MULTISPECIES: sigma-54 dependent transcriptional regulator [unclassified Ectothiorhodospira]MCG5515059.1 sigma-54 dependent transcriptional regulator [Ectothiorhodospira sp. 9100]MCG5517777.1 sigma-54 dependent transcriptional regulator [Ectothiorhodospira sp. 9905]